MQKENYDLKKYSWKFSATLKLLIFHAFFAIWFQCTLFGKIWSELLSRSEEEYEDYEDDYEEEDCGEDGYCTYSEVTWKTNGIFDLTLDSDDTEDY